MTTLSRFYRSLALSAVGLVAAGGALAQTWDLDACVSATAAQAANNNSTTQAAATTNCTSGTSRVSVSGWYSQITSTNSTTGISTGGNFSQGNLNMGSGWMGVQSRNSSNALETTANNNHSIDSLNDSGASFAEAVYLNFTKAVDLNNITAAWAHSSTAGMGNFQLWRWNNGTASPGAISGYTSAMTGWTSVTAGNGDFANGGYSKAVSDGTFYSSHWLVTTAFNSHNNDAFKLGQVTASGVCAGANQTGAGSSGGLCVPGNPNQTPEPATLAMVLMAVAGASVARRRKQAV